MRIAIIGSRGIPNEYGGFEQFAEYLSEGLAKKGCEVTVYASDSNSYKKPEYKGVKLIHCYDPERTVGQFGQFIYDLICILDSRKRNFDIIYQLGYTSSAIWNWLFSKNAILVTNTDGLEWQRSKYNRYVKKFLKYSEKTVANRSDYLICDSQAIKKYIDKKYNKNAVCISYGANLFKNPNEKFIHEFKLKPFQYFLVISRMQPDNNIETIIQGYINSESNYPMIIVGKLNNRYARRMESEYASDLVRFTGGIYDQHVLNNLRFYSTAYFHGHSAGGTNPSLLEAMAASAFICAHNNPFNREVLEDNAFYFTNSNDIEQFINSNNDNDLRKMYLGNNNKQIQTNYSVSKVTAQYFEFFNKLKK